MVKREEIRAMQDAWRAYLDLALGFTEASRKQATKVARRLVGKGNATAEQLQTMAEELVSTSLANRESLIRLVRFELDRTLGRVGLATADEVSDLTARVRDLERRLRDTEAAAPSDPAANGASGPATPAPAKTTPAKAQPAKAQPVKAQPATAQPVKAGPAKGAKAAEPAKAGSAKGGSPAKKAIAKKVVAKKAVAKKTTGTGEAGATR
jgi:polyhydroxyalkanoate synthesis regulator phasin